MAVEEPKEENLEEKLFFDPEVKEPFFKFLKKEYPAIYETFQELPPTFEEFWNKIEEDQLFGDATAHFLFEYTMDNSKILKEWLALPLDMPLEEIRNLDEDDLGEYWSELLSWKDKIFQVSGLQFDSVSIHGTAEEAYAEGLERLEGRCYLVPLDIFEACQRGERPWSDVYPPEKQES